MRPGRWRARLALWAGALRHDVVTLWMALRHPRTPRLARILAWATVIYALSPIDLIPDFIPVLGYLDDMIVLPVLVWLALRLMPADVLAECRERAQAWMAKVGRKPVAWLGAVLVAGVWGALAWGLWRAFAAA